MEKLAPVIKHHYWICFGLSVMFVFVGWWMASGSIAAETKARMESVAASMKSAADGKQKPNANSVEGAKKRNEVDALAYEKGSRILWERQKNARQWPDALAAEMKSIPYQGTIDNKRGTRTKWVRNYDKEIQKLLEIVKPFKDGEGLVVVDETRITKRNSAAWRTNLPSSSEIWEAQEDIWLLKSLLTSIAAVNEGATRITESQIREIYRLHLRGGDRAFTPPAAAAGGGGMGGGMGGGGMGGGMGMGGGAPGSELSGEDMYSGAGGQGMPGAMGGGAGASHPGKAFEGAAGSDVLSEEFGPVGGGGGGMGGGMGGGYSPGMSGGDMMGGVAMSGPPGGSMGGAVGGAAPKAEVRYVDNVEGHYKTRGFLLDVLIRDEKLPDLLASLTNSDFPVEIVRVEISSGRGAPVGGGMMGGGMSMTGGSGKLTGGMVGMGGGPPGMNGAGMTSGMGAGGDDGAMLGSGGGAMSLAGTPGGGFGGPGMKFGMGGPPGMGSYGAGAGGLAAQKGQEALAAAMSDPLLIYVKIGGLMTLYQSAQESTTAEATEAAAATEETAVPADAGATTDPAATDGAATDPTATPETGSESSSTPPADPASTTAVPDPGVTPSPVTGENPGAEPAPQASGDTTSEPTIVPAGTEPDPSGTEPTGPVIQPEGAGESPTAPSEPAGTDSPPGS